MGLRRWVRPAIAGALILVGAGAATAQRGAAIAALTGIERGQWVLKDAEGKIRSLCVGSPSSLVQLGHGAQNCQHVVMSSDAKSATVRYICPGHGQGLTTISVETARLVRVDTQGVADGAPFAMDFEGRRIGDCS
jgi:hypothetical protein